MVLDTVMSAQQAIKKQMSTDSNESAVPGKLLAFVPLVSAPPRPLPSTLLLDFTVDDDMQLVSSGAVKALSILMERMKNELEDYVLDVLGRAEAEPVESPAETPSPVDNPTRSGGGSGSNAGSVISPEAVEGVILALKGQPYILDKLPLSSSKTLRLYAANCWPVLVAIIGIRDDSRETNRIIQDIIVQPMSVVQHNSLAQLLVDRMSEIAPETLFKYLDAVESTCRIQQQGGMQQVHNVRLAVKIVGSALDLNSSLADAMYIELSSFCLSYPWVKDALDLYRRLMAMQQHQQQ